VSVRPAIATALTVSLSAPKTAVRKTVPRRQALGVPTAFDAGAPPLATAVDRAQPLPISSDFHEICQFERRLVGRPVAGRLRDLSLAVSATADIAPNLITAVQQDALQAPLQELQIH
jgi:hypothetical protein